MDILAPRQTMRGQESLRRFAADTRPRRHIMNLHSAFVHSSKHADAGFHRNVELRAQRLIEIHDHGQRLLH